MKVANIAKNTSYFTIALVFQKVISFSYFAILARNLMPEELGSYYLALSFTTIFAILIDLGLANVLTREVAKIPDGEDSKRQKDNLLRTVIFIKIPLAFVSVSAVVLLSNLLGYSLAVKHLIYISLVPMVLDSFVITFWSYIRAFHILKYESLGVILFQIIVFIGGLSFLKMGYGLNYLMAALAFASISVFSLAFYLVKVKFKARVFPLFDKKILKYIYKLSIPFALFAVLQRLYMYLDSVLLSVLAGEAYVGLYQIAFKIVFALQFLPMAFIASLYPAFALYYKSKSNQLSISFERAINYLLFISVPISLGIFILADKIMLIFKPEYMAAVWPLRFAILSLVFLFLNFPIGSLLNACDRQKTNTRNMFLGLLASILLNLWLIPQYQALGASITVLASNFLMFVLGVFSIANITDFRVRKMLYNFFKILTAGAIMALAVLYLKDSINVFINIIISAIIYIGAAFILGAIKKQDLESVFNSFIKK